MSTILYTTDFSDAAENALHFAVKLANISRSRLLLFHTYDIPYDHSERVDADIDALKRKSRKAMDKLEASIRGRSANAELEVETIIGTGSTVSSILEAAREIQPNLIVMGTRGASGLKKLFFGSNTAEIIMQAEFPVLAIPENFQFEHIEELVYATDYREADLEILNDVIQLARLLEVPVRVLHLTDEDTIMEEIKFRGFKDLVRETTQFENISHELLYSEQFLKGLDRYLEEHLKAVMSLGSYRHSLIERIVNRNTGLEMAYHSRLPLLVLLADRRLSISRPKAAPGVKVKA